MNSRTLIRIKDPGSSNYEYPPQCPDTEESFQSNGQLKGDNKRAYPVHNGH